MLITDHKPRESIPLNIQHMKDNAVYDHFDDHLTAQPIQVYSSNNYQPKEPVIIGSDASDVTNVVQNRQKYMQCNATYFSKNNIPHF